MEDQIEKDTHSQSPEYELLQHIKFCLECNNLAQAIRLIEKYGHNRTSHYYDISEVLHLMTLAFEQGFKKADIVEAGLEAKETDTEVNWIFLKYKK